VASGKQACGALRVPHLRCSTLHITIAQRLRAGLNHAAPPALDGRKKSQVKRGHGVPCLYFVSRFKKFKLAQCVLTGSVEVGRSLPTAGMPAPLQENLPERAGQALPLQQQANLNFGTLCTN
jgi:hypothetical protein